jgi:hypothetical protein
MGIFSKGTPETPEVSDLDLQYLAAASILGAQAGSLPTQKAIEVAINKARMLYEAMYLTEESTPTE